MLTQYVSRWSSVGNNFSLWNVYWNPEIWHQFCNWQSALTYSSCFTVMRWRSCGVLFFWEVQLFIHVLHSSMCCIHPCAQHLSLLIETVSPVLPIKKFMGGINITLIYSRIDHWYVLSSRNLLSVEEIKMPIGSYIIRSLQTDGESSLKPCHYILPVRAFMLVLAGDYFVCQVSRCRCLRLL